MFGPVGLASDFTRGGSGNYRIVVAESAITGGAGAISLRSAEVAADGQLANEGLALNEVISDVFIGTETFKFQIPYDAFVHTNLEAEVQLQAWLVDGAGLPD